MGAIVVLTEWDEFKRYNYRSFYDKMLKPAFLFDGRNMLDHTELERIGYEVQTLGKAKILATVQPRGQSDMNLSANSEVSARALRCNWACKGRPIRGPTQHHPNINTRKCLLSSSKIHHYGMHVVLGCFVQISRKTHNQ